MGFEFMFPSIYDGAQMQGRIELPFDVTDGSTARFKSWKPKTAIVAHPYQPLGGNCDDPVVRTVARELLQQGYVVGTFNFRGAGQSQGRTSWTGKGEVGDYTSFCIFMIEFIVNFLARRRSNDGDKEQDTALETLKGMEFVLGGYSYGSMIASNLPSIDIILDLFTDAHQEVDGEEGIEKTMHDFMLRLLQSRDKPADPAHHSKLKLKSGTLCVSYLLISPILPPVSSLATVSFFRPNLDLTFTSKNGITIACNPLEKKVMEGHRTLAVFGTSDMFCGIAKLRAWSTKMKAVEGSRFEECEVEGASHFWAERSHQAELRKAVRQWVVRGEAESSPSL